MGHLMETEQNTRMYVIMNKSRLHHVMVHSPLVSLMATMTCTGSTGVMSVGLSSSEMI